MNQELIIYACVALFTIGIMLLLCLDILKRSYELIQLNTVETTKAKAKVEVDAIVHEQKLAYPFYVGYINSTDKLSNTENSPTLNFQTTPKQPFIDESKIG
jgi:hypothetical protein